MQTEFNIFIVLLYFLAKIESFDVVKPQSMRVVLVGVATASRVRFMSCHIADDEPHDGPGMKIFLIHRVLVLALFANGHLGVEGVTNDRSHHFFVHKRRKTTRFK